MASQKTKSSVKISPGAVVCDESEIIGDVTIGTRTVIHPKAKIIAEDGPIIIGENNIIEELACIINKAPATASPGSPQAVMIIGNNNVFEVGSYIEATKIGDHNVIEARATVGRQVMLTSGCIIGAACTVTSSEDLDENCVIYGANCERRMQKEHPPAQTLQIDFLTKILPNYHYLKKPTKSSTPQRN
ncbi:dynactin subunit 6-like [Mya arenaria]|uniref:dynactin subunit 6-like n=1 Tax=Mya arenaria TaxID=6604 RepID=UPI0022E26840|nr:dynactin subunit 6-like [Mya arenaria]